ncbi:MAG TPA: RNA 2',3'-cyclic phosphodiesterase [Steroidobacteraceae bacterium]
MSDRLFFAFWPDDALRAEIAAAGIDWLRDYPCRPQRPDQWHLTVAFVGDVAADRQAALHDAAKSVEGYLSEPATIVLDRVQHWRKPQVLCVAATEVPVALQSLVAVLNAALEQRAFHTERREFRPHLTLARKARQPIDARSVRPLAWPVTKLWLVRSISDAAGSRYEPCAGWNVVQSLKGPSPQPSPADGGRGGRTSR